MSNTRSFNRLPKDSFSCLSRLSFEGKEVLYPSLSKLSEKFPQIRRFPFSIRILLESVLRSENGNEVTKKDIENFLSYDPTVPSAIEVPFNPARVLLQDFTGVPCVVDLAAMRAAVARLGGDPSRINPQIPVELVIDHSLQVDVWGRRDAAEENLKIEFERNRERYEFLRWGQKAFQNFKVVPPGGGICHQVNLEYLATLVRTLETPQGTLVYPDSVVGTDSHTTMINGLGVLGWGVGGIEAEATMLGQPLYMVAPPVVAVRLIGSLRSGVTATDLVLTLTQMLRAEGVVDKFVEFIGPGARSLSIPDRATLSNMAPEYGATMGFFPPDERSLQYLRDTGRPSSLVNLAEQYLSVQGLMNIEQSEELLYEKVLELDLSSIEPSISGPKRPQDRIALRSIQKEWKETLMRPVEKRGYGLTKEELNKKASFEVSGKGKREIGHGAVVIASITSCTNTSNPSVMLAAGLLARKAVELGLEPKPWVKTSLAPGSRVVTRYLESTGLLPYLERLGFHVVGYGCTTCIGNSGPIPEAISRAIAEGGIVAVSVLSGNRNFEGRVHPLTRANFLASPPLVVAYALAGRIDIDWEKEPIGYCGTDKAIYLRDLWPQDEEIISLMNRTIGSFRSAYEGIETANSLWNAIPIKGASLYEWDASSTYIQEPPFFQNLSKKVQPIRPIENARVLVIAGDSITTDHISPAGSISPSSPAGKYLLELGVSPKDFNSYGARRGNDRVMTRGTFANPRFRNLLVPGAEGSVTVHIPSGETADIYSVALRYQKEGTPTIILAGKDYGMGSSRDWAAKGVMLLGVRAVIAETFERIHRSNLVGMGVLPLQFLPGQNREAVGLEGTELYSIPISDKIQPGQELEVSVISREKKAKKFRVLCRLDSSVEVEYYRNGGILPTVLRRLLFE
ncbi:MAG: aconitate hydratase AcnA [Spirochaetes bacterium]|nr:aconitate hydratase AcnA [Spirochaetota bacterium]